jgi:CHAT domain-containing protein/Tfp pilus assembly protein PilF
MRVEGARRKMGIAALACSCWFGVAGAFLPPPSPRQPEEILERARNAYQAADYRVAAEMAQSALTRWRRPPRADFPAMVEAWVLLGNIFLESGDQDGAFQQFGAALSFAVERCGPRHPAVADALNGLGEYHYRRSELSLAEDYYRRALDIRLEVFGSSHEKTLASLNNLGNCHASAARYAEAIETHRQALESRRAILPPEHPDIAVSLNNLGNCLYLAGDPAGALVLLEQALAHRLKNLGPSHPRTASLYNSLGNCLAALGRSEDARQHYETALRWSLDALGRDHPTVASIWENLADWHFERGDYILALDRYRQAWNIQAHIHGAFSVSAMSLRHKIGLCRQYKGEYEEALSEHQSALGVLEEALGAEHPHIGALRNNLGNCWAGLKNYPEALAQYRAALLVFAIDPAASLSEIATTLNNMGAALLQAGEAGQALSVFSQAETFIPNDDLAARAITLKNGALAAARLGRRALADTLAAHARRLLPHCPSPVQTELRLAEGLLLWQTARQSVDIRLLESAAFALDTALRHTEMALLHLDDLEARAHSLAQHLPALRAAAEAYFLLFERAGEERFLRRAYELSEVDKNLQWAELSRRESLDAHAEIPDSIRALERQLSTEINRLEKERLLTADPARARTLELRLAEAREALRDFARRAAEAHPNYPGLRFSVIATDLDFARRRLLNQHQALIKYFDADSLWLVFIVTKDTLAGLRLPKSKDFNRKVSEFRLCLQSYIGAPPLVADSLAARYVDLALELYEELARSLRHSPAAAKTNWVLIPDGAASYLPFEALLSKRPSEPSLFKTHDYLVKKHQIAYAYSASHWAMLEQTRPARAKKYMAAFAPDFADHLAGLPPLRHSVAEARAASALFKGRLFAGAEASAEVFLREAGQYTLLLLATHGKAGRSIGDMSYLAFSHIPDIDEPPVVYTRDLYAMRIPAELVALSACETSVGEYRAGQGVISLAKGFFQAGARGVVATLWPVDDARHADLMSRFYENLKAGQRKDEALRRAKLDYLAERPHDEAHPAYWAGGTAWGNMRPLPRNAASAWAPPLAGAAALFILAAAGYWTWLRRKKS